MRKMLKSKKGFSLVELMIVVVIMGILIAVAVPLYGAVTKNSKNKSCAQNVESLREAARNYYLSESAVIDETGFKSMLEDGKMPVCPWHEGDPSKETDGSYEIFDAGEGKVYITCAEANVEGHTPVENGAAQPGGDHLAGPTNGGGDTETP